ncbi:MAG: lipoprotein-releasing ABC transporter permease subunit [Rhodobiaceae bacterium]|jgi:lipoprotein-releasing system permease protein|nr:lipoprotein-releasing ABC transporter permease subunit [Rhodobiaceae bacterium]MBT5518017.1 lipoprotein-releasing ABC transporter permease subunit [Rhodobiaceae bacterium]MDG2495063.1 lipoprotein-releasing ABC transporter permease subunit [Alphaproteobacteria bacterium]
MTRAFGALEWQIAGRYLRSRRRESFISVIAGISFIGIMLGVATLIVVMAVMTGFRADLLERILGVNGHATIRAYQNEFIDRDALVKKLEVADGVVFATPLVDGQAMLSSGSAVRGVLVRGLPLDKLKQLPSLQGNIIDGSLDDLTGTNTIAMGVRLAERHGFKIGDRVSLISPRGTITPFGTAPRLKQFKLAAIFRIGLSEYDLNFTFMPIGSAGAFFGLSENQGAIDVVLDDPDTIDQRAPELRDVVGAGHYVVDWKQSNSTLAGALEVERNVMFMILTMILLVAALNIISGLVMLVRDKGRDIAVLRSMGASRGLILRVFFITGASIGVFGTIAGVGLGTLFCAYIEEIRQFLIWSTGANLFPAEVYFLERMPALILTKDLLQVTGMALTLSFFSTLYPAWRAASMEPVEALRNE